MAHAEAQRKLAEAIEGYWRRAEEAEPPGD
jgi:hypothetical protein